MKTETIPTEVRNAVDNLYDYMHEEQNDYENNDKPSNHIWLDLNIVYDWFDDQEPTV